LLRDGGKSMKKIKLDRNTNFIIWEKYHKVESSKNIIIQFIDNKILDDNSQLLRKKLEEFIIYCDDFYKDLASKIRSSDNREVGELLNFNIDFLTRTYVYEFDENTRYNKLDFAINTLNLKSSYKYLIYRLIEGEIE